MAGEMSENMIAKAQSYIKQHDNEKARYTADELAMLEPKDSIVWYVKGKVHYMMEEYDDALASLSKAATIEAERPEIWLAMGYTLIALRRYDEAIQSLEYVMSTRPDEVESYVALCVVHTILQESGKAKQYLEQAASIDNNAASRMLTYFYQNFFAPSNAVSPEAKENIEILLKKLGA
ncbi:MAG: CDC27 family protein [Candidatus Micrarchaeia archaeon]